MTVLEAQKFLEKYLNAAVAADRSGAFVFIISAPLSYLNQIR